MFDSTKRSCFERGFAPSEGVVETVILGKVSSNPCCNTAMINSQPNGLVCHSSKVGPPRCLIPLDSRGHSFGGCESLFFHWKDSPLNGPTLKLHPSEPLQAPIKKNPTQKTTTSKQPGPHARHHKLASSPPPFLSHQYIDGHVTSSRSATLAAPNSVVSLAASNGNGSSARSATPPRLETCDFPWVFSLKIPKRKVGPPQLGDEAQKKHAKSYYVNDIYIQKKCPSIPKVMIYGIRMLS